MDAGCIEPAGYGAYTYLEHFEEDPTGLLPRLEGRITSATEVAHGKPAPDVFLLAAERLAVPASACIVIEDSLLGIEAALAAGMQVIGYAAMVGAADMLAAGATHVASTMAAVQELLAPD